MAGTATPLPELILCDRAGIRGEMIMFTSNDTPAGEYVEAKRLGAIINLDDISHIPFLNQHAGMPELICFRYNPGPLKGGTPSLARRSRQSTASPVRSFSRATERRVISGQNASVCTP